MAGGQNSQVTPLEQEANAWWLIPMLLQEGRTQAGKGGTPKPQPTPGLSLWARDEGQSLEGGA